MMKQKCVQSDSQSIYQVDKLIYGLLGTSYYIKISDLFVSQLESPLEHQKISSNKLNLYIKLLMCIYTIKLRCSLYRKFGIFLDLGFFYS